MAIEPTFTQLHTTFHSETAKDADKALRPHGERILHTHSKISSTSVKRALGLGKFVSQERVDARAEKKQAGAAIIKQSLDKEFGVGFGNRVFASILENTGQNMANGVTRRDMGTLMEAATRLHSSDVETQALAHTMAGSLMTLELTDGNAMEVVSGALQVISNPTVEDGVRDLYAETLREKFAAATSDAWNSLFHDQELKADDLKTLLGARLTNGEPLFSHAEKLAFLDKTLTDQIPREKPTSFLRGATVATTIMADLLSSADGGQLERLKDGLKDIIIAAFVDYPAETPAETKQADTLRLLATMNAYFEDIEVGPELREAFSHIGGCIDNAPGETGWTGADFNKNTLVLRGLIAGTFVQDIRNVTGVDAFDAKSDPGLTAVAFLQKIVGESSTFNQPERKFLEPELAVVRGPDSGLSSLIAQITD